MTASLSSAIHSHNFPSLLPKTRLSVIYEKKFKMPLCNSCNALDIRRLLLSFKQNMEQNDGLGGGGIALKPVPYHDSILSIRHGARHSCELCSMIWNTSMQEHDISRNGVDQETSFTESADENFAHKFGGPVLLSVKGPPKARIEVYTRSKFLMAFFPFQETGAYAEIWHVNV